MEKYYLAVDIGASSGRHILGHLENGKIELEEIYRFENGMDHKDGKLLWDVNRLFGEIVARHEKMQRTGQDSGEHGNRHLGCGLCICWTKRIKFWVILTVIVITARMAWTRRWRKSCRRPNCMAKQVFRSRFSIPIYQLMAVESSRPRRL